MSADFLHNHTEFPELIRIVAQQKGIDPALVEKDYWITHCLYGLQQLGFTFELKGGTSLSKGFQIINRFSEDIDIRIEPPNDRHVKTGPNQDKPAHIQSRRDFYDWLAQTIRIDGIDKVERDTAFDNRTLMSAGIRLYYRTHANALLGLRPGVLLEVGFDDVTPNSKKDISSWLYDHAVGKVNIIGNRAKGVACYDLGYTFVEKLQTISTKFRKQQANKDSPIEFMRHYYDVYALLQRKEVQAFIGTDDYQSHKAKRFRGGDNPIIAHNQAFIQTDLDTRKAYTLAFAESAALYYGTKPTFDQVLEEIGKWIDRL
ncbi:MAG TPA: nucleotidyl transferase AbiEii/AbiGii toxin family protein [Alphaproteobacteria bacterium]|nr:nucleotidyl transferase AbiEii/AbiGii toxin family protein [Alphaproteobacteria bacterium]